MLDWAGCWSRNSGRPPSPPPFQAQLHVVASSFANVHPLPPQSFNLPTLSLLYLPTPPSHSENTPFSLSIHVVFFSVTVGLSAHSFAWVIV